jgi:tRNA pseudouridine13 synthase
MLARSIERATRPDQRVLIDFKVATLPIHRALDPEQAEALAALKIPLPSSRTSIPDDNPLSEVARDVLAPFGLAWTDLRVRHLKDVFFSKGLRPALFHASDLAHDSGNDELQPGRKRLQLAFELPKGAYATLVVKRLTDAAL